MESSTASSAASTTASKRSSSRRPATAVRRPGAPSRSKRHVGRGGQEDLAAAVVGGRPRPCEPEPDPAGEPGAVAAGDRRVGDDDADARPGGAAGPPSAPGSSAPTGTPATVSRLRSPKLVSSSTATVCPSGVTRDDVPMPPLKPRHDMPVPAPTAPSSGGAGAAARERPPRRVPAPHVSAVSTCITRQSLRNESSHSPTTGMTTSSATPECSSARSGRPRRRPGRAASSTSGRPASRPTPHSAAVRKPVHSPAPLSTAPPAAAAACRRPRPARAVVTPVRASPLPAGGAGSSRTSGGVAETDAGHVEDGVGRAGRQHPDADPELAGARHAVILPEPRRRVVGY